MTLFLLGALTATVLITAVSLASIAHSDRRSIYPPLTPRPDPRPLAWTGYERN